MLEWFNKSSSSSKHFPYTIFLCQYSEIPSPVLQPSSQSPREPEVYWCHGDQAQGDADLLQARSDGETRRKHFGGDADGQMWRPWCRGIQPLPQTPQMAEHQCHLQVSVSHNLYDIHVMINTFHQYDIARYVLCEYSKNNEKADYFAHSLMWTHNHSFFHFASHWRVYYSLQNSQLYTWFEEVWCEQSHPKRADCLVRRHPSDLQKAVRGKCWHHDRLWEQR